MAVTFVRSGLMTPGKYKEAMQWVVDRNLWLMETFDIEPALMVLLGGEVERIAIAEELESLAQTEEIRRHLACGARPEELSAGREGLFVPGQSRERLWLHIPN